MGYISIMDYSKKCSYLLEITGKGAALLRYTVCDKTKLFKLTDQMSKTKGLTSICSYLVDKTGFSLIYKIRPKSCRHFKIYAN